MRCGHYQRSVVLILAWLYLSLSSLHAVAASVPAFNGRMNAAVGSLVQSKVGKWGFAANDPRVGATTSGVASGLTTLAVGIAGGAVAAVGWPALLVAAGISAVVGGAVSLAQDAISKWLFNSNGTVTASYTGATEPSQKGPDTWVARGGLWKAGTQHAMAGQWASDFQAASLPVVLTVFVDWCLDDGTCSFGYSNSAGTNHDWHRESFSKQVGVPYTCDGVTINDVCQPPKTTAQPAVTSSLPTAIANISATDAAKPISDELLAAAGNASWKAADPAQGGLPWSASDPITPADVAAWRSANPSMVPTVGDAISPVSNGSVVSVGTGTATGPVVNPTPGTGEKIDLGPDPNTPAPALEPTPTASQVLSPLLNLMPDLKSFAVPAHISVCPTGSFVALGKTYALDSHCSLLESNRLLIDAAMLLCWTLSSVFIVLRA